MAFEHIRLHGRFQGSCLLLCRGLCVSAVASSLSQAVKRSIKPLHHAVFQGKDVYKLSAVNEGQGPRNCRIVELMLPKVNEVSTLKTKHLNLPVVAAHSDASDMGVKCKSLNTISTAEDLQASCFYKISLPIFSDQRVGSYVEHLPPFVA